MNIIPALCVRIIHLIRTPAFFSHALILLMPCFSLQAQEIDQATKIGVRQRANYDLYQRVLSFSRISWASPPVVDIGSEKKFYILSADISPQFTIGGERFPIVFQLTPRYMVRIFRNNKKFNDTSLPVRTPSYLPGGTFYFPLSRRLKNAKAYNWYRDLNYLNVSVFHHSNGQDGPELIDNEINLYNGNFSTNFAEVGYNFVTRTEARDATFGSSCNGDDDCLQNEMKHGYRDFYGKAGLEQHFNTTSALKGLYGTTRINLTFTYVKTYNTRMVIYTKDGKVKSGSHIANDSTGVNQDVVQKVVNKDIEEKKSNCQVVGRCYQKEFVRFTLNSSLIANKLNENSGLTNRINFDLGMYVRLSGKNTAWFLMAGYYGSDPYNIYFQKSYWFARTGIAMGFFNYTNKFQYDN